MARPASETARILIVEDDPDQLALLEQLLHSMHYQVRTASTVSAARETAIEWQPDIVLLDYFLPDGTGADLLGTLAGLESAPGIMAMSAAPERFILEELLAMGPGDLLRKPVEPVEVILKLSHLLHARQFVAEAKENEARTNEQKDRLRRYFPTHIADQIMNGTISENVGGRLMQASILILDVRDSTTLAETMEPARFAGFLSELFADMVDIVVGHAGTVVAFTGDGFLAMFEGEEAAVDAARVAVRIRGHLEMYNSLNPYNLDNPLRIGMGIATGQVFCGTIGTIHRLDYTVLGDPVNLASRLQSLSKLAKVDLLVDGSTADAVASLGSFRRVRADRIRGKMRAVRIFYLVSLQEPSGSRRD